MNADLHVTTGLIDDLVATLSGFGRQLGQAVADIRTGDAAVTGPDPLAGRVHGFADSWHYGLTQLGQHAARCETMLRQVGPAFGATDQQLARAVSAHQASAHQASAHQASAQASSHSAGG
jgi:hypothetical protein